ncbi:hypothetical protein [Terribacillus saccharophilus]|uniref:hypothetical protein n=1 Tax=Terribacillus saccharophilus TaxID=361277 RepID=UPI002989B758|nr:hypothetical protein [Terribacillus saccharophilus]MCM3227511.1 hypothetical protein [Terribacillus saccharophilus]
MNYQNELLVVTRYIGLTFAQKSFLSDLKEYERLKLRSGSIFIWKTESILKQMDKDKTKLERTQRVQVKIKEKNPAYRTYYWSTKKGSGELTKSVQELANLTESVINEYWNNPDIEIEQRGWY